MDIINIILRGFQFILSVITIAFISESLKSINGYQITSKNITFLIITNFTVILYTTYYLIRYHLLNIALIHIIFILLFDILLIMFLITGGVVASTSNIYNNCDGIYSVKCDLLTGSIILSFINSTLFIGAFVLNLYNYYCKKEKEINTPIFNNREYF